MITPLSSALLLIENDILVLVYLKKKNSWKVCMFGGHSVGLGFFLSLHLMATNQTSKQIHFFITYKKHYHNKKEIRRQTYGQFDKLIDNVRLISKIWKSVFFFFKCTSFNALTEKCILVRKSITFLIEV